MFGKRLVRIAVASICVLALDKAGAGRADFEGQLLQKFQTQNQTAAAKLKEEIKGHLARAATLRTERPEHALELVRKNLDRLEQDSLLPREERTVLLQECRERMGDLKQLLAEKEKESPPPASISTPDKLAEPLASRSIGKGYPMSNKEEADLRRRRGVGQAFAANVQVTPVVSADRRFVRIGVVGRFIGPSGNAPLIPIQVPVPSVFPGPGPGVVTVGQPIGLFQVVLPQLSLAGMGVNTTVSVPAGGSRVVAGYSSLVESRYESGTPVLGKIPYLGRLFRNVGYGRSSQATEVIVSPRVIVLE